MRKGWSLAFAGVLAWGAWAAAAGCGSDPSNGGSTSDDGGGGDDGSTLLTNGEGGMAEKLVIQPSSPSLDVSAPGATLQFDALIRGAHVPAQWTIDVADVGSIDGSGLFTASALLGGPVTVTANARGLSASTLLTIKLHLTDNPGNVDPGTQGTLKGGGTSDAAFRWLYPYDVTVFPRDVPSPSLQFATTPPAAGANAFDAAYVHVSYGNVEYQGFYGPSSPARIRIAAPMWKAITGSTIGTDAVKAEVTIIAGGKVTGPIAETWTVAHGNLRGSIYYNSYNSALPGLPPIPSTFPQVTGAVLKLRPGMAQPTVVIATNSNGECHTCHVVSANGGMLVAGNEANGATFTATDGVYDLAANATKVFDAPNRTWDFGALYPDGSRFLRYGAVPWADPKAPWVPDVRGIGNATTEVPSALFNPRTGAPIPAPGLDGANLNMMMPTFSSDGKLVAFNHYDTGAGHTIAVMDFAVATNTFSNLRDVATLPTTAFAGWPTFTPDDEYVLFAGGTNNEYDTVADTGAQPTSNIYVAHVASKTIATADALNGVLAAKVYLPLTDDPNLNFEPTILPVASGGYFWVVFTSRRNYGNTVNGDPYAGVGGAPSSRKKLWVAAIDIDSAEHPASAAHDITHPAFYLDGQELGSGNMRAFWALDACAPSGATCETGDECCTGFCRQTTGSDGGIVFACVPQPNGCAQENEKCTTAADCCGAAQSYQCTNGFCARPSPK